MKYNGFYFWMFKGSMKRVLTEKYSKAYAAEVMKRSGAVYRELVEKADDIGDDNPMAYNELFALAFVAPYVASGKRIPPETVQEMHRTAQKEKTEDYSRGFIEVRETVFALQFAPVSCKLMVRQYCRQNQERQ